MKRISAVFFAALGLSCAAYGQSPAITAVLDAAAYTSGIAQGSVFVVKGTNLSGAGYVPASGLPLATTLNNVKVTFTPVAGGAGTDAYMVYTYNVSGVNQLAALLPSTVAVGNYNVTVTNGSSTGAGFRAAVVRRKLGMITQDGSGTGNVVAQNFISQTQYDVNRYTTGSYAGTNPLITYSPSKPGQVVVLWLTGYGPLSGVADNVAPGAVEFRNTTTTRVLINGVSITPDIYAGRAPSLPGTDEIIFTLPASVATGCAVPIQVSVDGQVSSPGTTIAIAPNSSATACVSAQFSADTLAKLDGGAGITTGSFALTQFSTKQSIPSFGTVTAKLESASGAFSRYPGSQLASALTLYNPSGQCIVYHQVGTQSSLLTGTAPTVLDAGTITLNGPNVANKVMTKTANAYSLDLGTAISGLPLPPGVTIPGISTTPVISAGTYTLAGAGGADVGRFNASVTVGPALTLGSDLPATVNRNNPLTVNWTGGNASDLVQLVGVSGTVAGGTSQNPLYDATVFLCTATAGQGTVTVPASILQQMTPTPPDFQTAGTGVGTLFLVSNTLPAPGNGLFTAPLTAGGNIDLGTFIGTIGYLSLSQFQ